MRDVFTCPYRFKCGCYCALSVKTFSDKVEVALAGEHTASSHSRSSGVLSVTVKQRSAVKRAVRSSQHSVCSQVQVSLENFSPGMRVPFDRRSQKAVSWKEIMAERVPGIDLDNTEGAMNRHADSICLIKLLARHNDPADEFHMDEHQVVQVGHQFKDGVTSMTLTTQHHSTTWRVRTIANSKYRDILTVLLIGAAGNLHCSASGAHYIPFSISIVNSESKTSLEWSYNATCAMDASQTP